MGESGTGGRCDQQHVYCNEWDTNKGVAVAGRGGRQPHGDPPPLDPLLMYPTLEMISRKDQLTIPSCSVSFLPVLFRYALSEP